MIVLMYYFVLGLLTGSFLLLLLSCVSHSMKMGTKSLLYGAHQFILHPFFLSIAWMKLYGFPLDYKLWVAFVVHDWGYWGKENIDGKDGKTHPELGGRIMEYLFGKEWGDFTRCHSRSYATLLGKKPSKLCAADKYVFVVTPRILYVPFVLLTGEYYEYLEQMNKWLIREGQPCVDTVEVWYNVLRAYFCNEVKRLIKEIQC